MKSSLEVYIFAVVSMDGMSMYPSPFTIAYSPLRVGKRKTLLSMKTCGLSSRESCLQRIRTSFSFVFLKCAVACLICSAVMMNGFLLKLCL